MSDIIIKADEHLLPGEIADGFTQLAPGGSFLIERFDLDRLMRDYNAGEIKIADAMGYIRQYQDHPPESLDVRAVETEILRVGFRALRRRDVSAYKVEYSARKPLGLEARKTPGHVFLHTDYTPHHASGVIAYALGLLLEAHGFTIVGVMDRELPAHDSIPAEWRERIEFEPENFGQHPRHLFIGHVGQSREIAALPEGAWAYLFHEYDRLPRRWLDNLARLDRIFMPSEFCIAAMRESGWREPITLLPHGVDLDLFHPQKRQKTRWPDEFVFLTVARQSKRKGIQELIEAFKGEFTPEDKIRLVIKDTDEIGGEWQAFLPRGKKHRITVLRENMSRADLALLYREADAYVSPSRSEGFGMTYLEAMASGLPVIANLRGAQRQFLTEENAFLVNSQRFTRLEGAPPDVSTLWNRIDPGELGHVMRRVYGDHANRVKIAAAGLETAQRMSWAGAMKPLIKALSAA